VKVFISTDIEGVTTTTTLEECNERDRLYSMHARQLTEEVLAAIAGARAAGATEIVVNDAHGTGRNIDPTRIPSGVLLLRDWNSHPYAMVQGIDASFDAAMFLGYHCASGRMGSPMAHTMSAKHVQHLKINGEIASEFMLASYACALEGVPSVFLSGDKAICDDSANLHPKLVTCTVKEGIGGMTINYSPEDTLKSIKALTEKALRQDLKRALVTLPDNFDAELYFKRHVQAEKASYFPGVTMISDHVVTFSSGNFFDILNTINWIMPWS